MFKSYVLAIFKKTCTLSVCEKVMDGELIMSARRIARTGLFTAIVFISTTSIRIPDPLGTGYIHPGDAAIVLAAFLFGPGLAAFAGGVGAALADWVGGYTIWIPATLLIKAVMGGLAGWMIRIPLARRYPLPGMVLAAVLAGAWMALGYFIYEGLVITGIWHTAWLKLPGNLVQAGFGGIVGVILAQRLRKFADGGLDLFSTPPPE